VADGDHPPKEETAAAAAAAAPEVPELPAAPSPAAAAAAATEEEVDDDDLAQVYDSVLREKFSRELSSSTSPRHGVPAKRFHQGDSGSSTSPRLPVFDLPQLQFLPTRRPQQLLLQPEEDLTAPTVVDPLATRRVHSLAARRHGGEFHRRGLPFAVELVQEETRVRQQAEVTTRFKDRVILGDRQQQQQQQQPLRFSKSMVQVAAPVIVN